MRALKPLGEAGVHLFGVAVLGLVLAGPSRAQPPDALPPLPADPGAEDVSNATEFQLDPPLSAITIDVRPRDRDGAVVPEDDLPAGCWSSSGKEGPAIFIGGGAWCCAWNCHDLLQPARFRHPPLYFEDEALERRGELACCPALHAAAHFACDLALLPARLLIDCPGVCVWTPTPHCCSPDLCDACGH